MKKVFAYDGKMIEITNKFGELCILSVITILCCIPVVSIGPALISLYYSVMKCVRCERGNMLQEYVSNFKRVFKEGVIATLLLLVWGYVLYTGWMFGNAQQSITGRIFRAAESFFILLTAFCMIYLFPVM